MRANTIRKFPGPNFIKQLHSVLDMVDFVRRFIKNCAEVTAPLVAFTTKVPVIKEKTRKAWGLAQDADFALIKRAMSLTPVLNFPGLSREFVGHTDASEAGAGAFLAQTK